MPQELHQKSWDVCFAEDMLNAGKGATNFSTFSKAQDLGYLGYLGPWEVRENSRKTVAEDFCLQTICDSCGRSAEPSKVVSRCCVGRPGRSTSTLRSISANRAATLQCVSISGCLSCSVACHHGRDTNQTFGQNAWGKVSMFVIWPPQPSRNPTSEWLEVLDRLPAVHGFQPLHGKGASPADGFKHPLQGSFWGTWAKKQITRF